MLFVRKYTVSGIVRPDILADRSSALGEREHTGGSPAGESHAPRMGKQSLIALIPVLGLMMIFSPRAFGQVINIADCNDPDAKIACVRPTQAIVDALYASGYPYYIGHAEPTLEFFSNAGASGNNMQWKFKLPATEPTPNQAGTNTANFELYAAHWVGMSLCDPNSSPFGPCTPNSDTNTAAGAGSAFLELQFFPPGSIFTGSGSCSNTQWCVLLHINSVNVCNIETTTAAFVTTDGTTGGPKLFLNNGDTILVTLKDTANGLRADVSDQTTAGSGFMVASGANGFQHNADQNPANCKVFSNFDFHPEYMTAAPGNYTAWAGLHPNISFDHEIGHWELCTDAACSTNPDPAEQTTMGACTTVRGIGGCTDSDKDHDGTSYAADYADGTAAHPAPVIITSPTNNGVGPLSSSTVGGTTYTQSYKTISFKTTEGTNGPFYPFYTQAGTGSPCVFNFGNDIPGTTTNDFSKAAQYGTTITNPCIPVAAATPTLTKSFSPNQIPQGSASTLAFTIKNTDPAITLTGAGFTDTLPAGIIIASPNGLTGSCGGGTISAVAGSNFISLSGASLAPSASCTFSLTVQGKLAGSWLNTTSTLTSDEAADGTAASAVLQVFLPPNISKSFAPTKILPGGVSTVSFVISNPNSFGALTGVAFTDTLPVSLVIASSPGVTSTCGGMTTAIGGSNTISLSGGIIAALGSCTVTANVTAPEGIHVNTVSVTSTNGGNGNTSSATLFVASPPNLSKTFGEVSISPHGSTTLSFNLTNPNHVVTLTGLAFTDTLPSGLVVATPNGLTGSCDGGVITAAAGSNVLTLAGAALAPQTSCTFRINVTATGTVLGYVINTTGSVTSNEAIPGGAASATLFIGDPFQISYTSNLSYADSAVNITNSGDNASGVNPVTGALNGNLCVNVYTFSPDEQLIDCCACHVTPNALWSLSARSDLISNTLTPGVATSIVVKLVATLAGPAGASGPGSTTAPTCNTATVAPFGPAGAANTLANGLAAWGTSVHGLGVSSLLPDGGTVPPAGTSLALTETDFTHSTLSAAEISRLTTLCGFIQGNGTGFGICKDCRFGGLGGGKQ